VNSKKGTKRGAFSPSARSALRQRDRCFVHCDSTWVPDRLFQGLPRAFLDKDQSAETGGYNHYCSAEKIELSAPRG
jgi:hypothetical protein